ncbi:MAG: APC family permease [Candidatus Freyarchaeota archaeon]
MGEEEVVFVRRASGLVRELAWYDIALWVLAGPAAGGMTYYLVKLLGGSPGGDLGLAFLIGGLLYIPLALLMAVISGSFPRASSLYVIVSRIVHPAIGYLSFWQWIVGGGAAMAAGLVAFLGIKAFAGAATAAGCIARDPTLIAIGGALTDPMNQLIAAIIIIALVWIFNVAGMKLVKWAMRIFTAIPLAITIGALIGLMTLGASGALARWDAVYGAGNAANIISLATTGSAAGISIDTPIKPGDYWSSTYDMLTWTIWAYTGLESVSFVGSEVKTPKKSYFRGYIIGLSAVIALYLFNAYVITWAFPYKFLESYSYLQMNYRSQLEQLMGAPAPDPSVPFITSIAFLNVPLSILIGVGYFLWYLTTIIVIWVGAIRGFFAMAFDRALPEAMANVTAGGTPTWANHVTALIALLGAFITLGDTMGFSLATSILSYMDFSCLYFVWTIGLAAMILPYFRRDLFDKCVVQSKIGGIPVVSLLGAIVFAIGWFFIILTSYTDLLIVLVNIAVCLAGLLIFIYMQSRNTARGIDVRRIYTEIPPE